MPAHAKLGPLTLVEALNKLKHRDTKAVNFTVSPSGNHVLFIFTIGGMGKPDSIASFDLDVFCNACKMAAQEL